MNHVIHINTYNIYNVSMKGVGIWDYFCDILNLMFVCQFCGGLHVRLPKTCWCVKNSLVRIGNSLAQIRNWPANHQETISKVEISLLAVEDHYAERIGETNQFTAQHAW